MKNYAEIQNQTVEQLAKEFRERESVTLSQEEIDFLAKNKDGFIALKNGFEKSKNPANLIAINKRREELGL
jgi:predicted transcriptional regulator